MVGTPTRCQSVEVVFERSKRKVKKDEEPLSPESVSPPGVQEGTSVLTKRNDSSY